MTHRITTALFSLYMLLLMTAPAAANPIGKIQELFKSGTDLLLTYIVPILAACILAWQALLVGFGRKQFGDIFIVACACAVAVSASFIIKFMMSS